MSEKKKSLLPIAVASSLLSLIFQVFIEATVFFFTTLGLEKFFKKKD